MNYPKSVAIASDHAGVEYKTELIQFLEAKGISIENFGTNTTDSCDYPDYGHPLAASVDSGKHPLGIIICGSGNGVCMTVNKHQNVRGALSWNEDITRLARQHNDANVLCLPARFISIEEAKSLTDIFLTTEFEGGRHQRRVNKISIHS